MVVYCKVCEIIDILVEKSKFSYPLIFNLHGPLELLQMFAQNSSTNCPSQWVVRRCKNISEKFKYQPRVQQRYRQTDRWQADVSYMP